MTPATLTRKDFLSVLDLEAMELERCLELASGLKAERRLGRHASTAEALDRRHVAMLFEKPSLRTRSTFEIAVRELGGHVVALQPDVALGRREPVADVARNLERWVDAVIIRTFSQEVLEEFARAKHVMAPLQSRAAVPRSAADARTGRWAIRGHPNFALRRGRPGRTAGAPMDAELASPLRRYEKPRGAKSCRTTDLLWNASSSRRGSSTTLASPRRSGRLRRSRPRPRVGRAAGVRRHAALTCANRAKRYSLAGAAGRSWQAKDGMSRALSGRVCRDLLSSGAQGVPVMNRGA